MPNKTIYVSDSDTELFEEAKTIAGEALSSVITRALREFVARKREHAKGMKEVAVRVGAHGSEREMRFVGVLMQKWEGFSDDKQWWMSATIFRTQKGNWAIHLVTIAKATLLTNKRAWKASGDYLIDVRKADLIVGSTPEDFKGKIPQELFLKYTDLIEKDEKPVEYLDI